MTDSGRENNDPAGVGGMPSPDRPADDRIEAQWDSGLQLAFAKPEAGAPSVFMQSLHLRAGKSLKVALRDITGDGRRMSVSPHAVDWQAGGTGRYRVRGEIARGGVGVVLLAHDGDLGREIAVKVLHARHATDLTMLQRFVEEAQIGGQLQHPGIVPVYELGIDLRDQPYFTMKLVQGKTLATLLREREHPGSEQGRWLAAFARVCETVAYAHARGVVHRDLKPGNVMVGEFGEVLVMDWGFAKVIGRVPDRVDPAATAAAPVTTQRDEPLSVAGSVLGTPAYMPPEQAAGELERLDARADVFALGAILCEILTGQPPYTGDDVLRRAKAGELQPAFDALATCAADAQIVALCRSCLTADPAARPATAADVSAAMAAFFASTEQRAGEARIEAAAARARAEEERKRRRLAWALAAAGLVLLGTGGWFFYQHGERVAFTAREAHAELNAAWQAVADGDLRRADEAVGRARTIVRAGTPDAETTRAVEAASERVAALRLNEDLRRRVLEVRLQFPPEAGPDAAALAQLLRDLRVDVAGDAPNVPAGLDDDVALALATAASDVALRGSGRGGARLAPARLLALADVLDPDDGRDAIRAATIAKDLAALRAIAVRFESDSVPAVSSELLALALQGAGSFAEALAALEVGQTRHPDDFWLNHHLAQMYRLADPPQHDASRRHRMLADATNPMRRYRPDPPPPGARGPGGRRRGH